MTIKLSLYSLLLLSLVGLSSCNDNSSTINTRLQEELSTVIETYASEAKADSVLILVMETKTGRIKALLSLVKSTDSSKYKQGSNTAFYTQQEPGKVFAPISMMAAMEYSGLSEHDTVDAGKGFYAVGTIGTVADRNWKDGGFGKITLSESISLMSIIGVVKTIERCFESNPHQFIRQLQKMSVGQPAMHPIDVKNIAQSNKLFFAASGYGITLSPMQLAAFYNAIANNGVMVKPAMIEKSAEIINPKICSKQTLVAIQKSCRNAITKGFCVEANTTSTQAAGFAGSFVSEDEQTETIRSVFCGYFPYQNPQYSCMIVIYNSHSTGVEKRMFKDVAASCVKTGN